jgi:hypothetical protein
MIADEFLQSPIPFRVSHHGEFSIGRSFLCRPPQLGLRLL